VKKSDDTGHGGKRKREKLCVYLFDIWI